MLRNESLDELVRRVARQRIATWETPKKKAPARDWAALGLLEFIELLGVQPLSEPQRVICKVVFQGIEPKDLEGEEWEIGQRLLKPPSQAEPVDVIPKGARSVFTLVKGGRIGGTYLSALYACHRALVCDLSTLAPGEVARVIFGGPDADVATQGLVFAVGVFQSHPELTPLIEGQPTAGRLVIERPSDGRKVEFVVRTASKGGRSFRSRSLVCACLTEVAFFLGPDNVINGEDCFNACTPRVLPGGLTILESTPHAEFGLLFDEFDRNWGHPSTSLAMHAPTMFVLPTERNRLVYEATLETNPEKAAREFGAEFIAAGSLIFFSREVLKRCDTPGTGTTEAPGPGELGAIGGDLGLTHDAAAFAAVHRLPAPKAPGADERRNPMTDRYRVVECIERKPVRGTPLRLGDLVPLACDLAHRHGERSVLVDQWSVQPAREHLPKGYNLETDPTEEAAMYDAVLELMKAGQVEIPAEFTALLRQLPIVMSKPTPGGGKKIILPRKFGSHCDLVPAFVKAVWKAKRADVGANTGQPKGLRKRAMASTGGY